MALATQCPHCHTTFRVAHDQLKLRSGSVRCGACQQVFNGIEHLLRPDSATAMPATSAAAAPKSATLTPRATTVEMVVKPAPVIDPSPQKTASPDGTSLLAPIHTSTELASSSSPIPPVAKAAPAIDSAKKVEEDPLQRMTLVDFSEVDDDEEIDDIEVTQEESNVVDSISVIATAPEATLKTEPITAPISSAIHPSETKHAATPESHPQFDQTIESNTEEPAFVIQGRRQQRSRRVLRALVRIACFMLTAGFLLQGTYYFRDLISAWYPQSTNTLVQACSVIGCEIKLPAQIEKISIESSDLQNIGGADKNTFELTLLLRNQSHIVQQWPFIELTLNDSNEKAILRRSFRPEDFSLSTQDLEKGIAANSEQAMKLSFELPEIKASGFRVHSYFP
ncbi:MAG: DUF3426 domain-containing protein [Pseudomonadota bacterium]